MTKTENGIVTTETSEKLNTILQDINDALKKFSDVMEESGQSMTMTYSMGVKQVSQWTSTG
jgi:hypothetical protein